MWRVEVTEIGRTPLPPIDLEADEFVIGSSEGCQLRLPARAVHPQHLRLRRLGERPLRLAWSAGHQVEIDGAVHQAGAHGEASEAMLAVIGTYRLQITEARGASVPTSPQRTESLVREMIRNIMGGAAPRLVVEVGPAIGSSRTLAPPDSRMTVGRGDEADWVILDEDLSRVHAALVRTWDGVRVVDLGSKNGTLVDGVAVPSGDQGLELKNGVRITFGDVVVRYLDEAETYLEEMAGESGAASAGPAASHAGIQAASPTARQPPGQPSGRPPGPAAARPGTAPPAPMPGAPSAPVASSTLVAPSASAPSSAPGGSLLLIGLGLGVAAAAVAAALWLLGAG